MPKGTSIIIPEVSSQRRIYIPMGFIGPETFCSNKVRLIPNATLYHFGVLQSLFHNAWVRMVSGRLKNDYQYSANVVYNNFVWPEPTDTQRSEIECCAQAVLDARAAQQDATLADMYGLDYDDPAWDELLDQLTFEEMDTLIASGGYGNAAIESIAKAYQYDLDGPAALNNNFTGVGSIGFPSSVSVACTWNKDLAHEYGLVIGDMAIEMDTTGWYAPAVNIHRSQFCGRTFEYFSEDGLLTGAIAAQEVAGAKERGVYAFVKHFALNEQETNRESMLCTWANEQSIREIYLKPFELTVKDGGTTAIMSSFNYVGTTYSGGSSNLLQSVLRDEWGFEGAVITDYYGGFGYQNADQCIRNGNDLMLASTDTTNHVTDESATSVAAMREAAHNILFMAGHSWRYANGDPQAGILAWQWIDYVASGIVIAALVILEVVTIRRFLSERSR